MSAPLRIASLTTFYPPHNFGGDGVDVQRTARALARRGHQVTVIYDRDAHRALAAGQDVPVPSDPDVEVVALESRLGRLSLLLAHQVGRPVVHARTLAALDRARRFDVVLLNNVSLVGGPGIMGYGRDAVRIYIAHEHWLVCPTHVLWKHTNEACDARACLKCVIAHHRPPQLWRYTGAVDRAAQHVHAFVARSEFSRAKHQAMGFPREMDVLPYFVPLAEQPYAGPTPHPRPFFLYVGRLEPIKGVDDLIRAFPRNGVADLLIAGDGTQGPELRTLAAGHPRIAFLGRLPHEALARYYRHALAAVVPSRCYETFGLVVVEAFSQGTPVIARRMGPLPELVRAAAAGETFATSEELSAVIGAFAADPGRARRLGAAGRQAVAAFWSEDIVIDALLAIIERERHRRPTALRADRAPAAVTT